MSNFNSMQFKMQVKKYVLFPLEAETKSVLSKTGIVSICVDRMKLQTSALRWHSVLSVFYSEPGILKVKPIQALKVTGKYDHEKQ